MESKQLSEEHFLEENFLDEMDDLSILFRRVDSIHLSLDDFYNELDCLHIDSSTFMAATGSIRSMRNLLQMITDLARKEANEAQKKYQTLVDQRKNKEEKENG